jgi:deoxyribodipyrimidine photo-lyase
VLPHLREQDWRYHKTASIRVDFILRTLNVLKHDLAHLDIPLHVQVVEPRTDIPSTIVELMNRWDATEIFANIEYEIDELHRDTQLLEPAENARIKATFIHDQCVVEPGIIKSAVTFASSISNA